MGRIGTAAYDDMHSRYGGAVIGVDFDAKTVAEHRQAGRHVILGDATDIDFWERVQAGGKAKLGVIMLAMSEHITNMTAVKELTARRFEGIITATAKFDDEVTELKNAGVQAAYNLYAEAGFGFAEHVSKTVKPKEDEL
jgi:Trk K+ transport system NAD-binding subunit